MSKPRKRLLIVDGYNVLRSGSRYRDIEPPDYTDDYFNVAREKLVNDVISYVGRNTNAIIVYDAGQRVGQPSDVTKVGGVQIVFSPVGRSADFIIEKLSHDARERYVETIVVTSDATIQDTVFGGVVTRMSAEGFCRELAAMEDNRREDKSPEISHKNTVEGRIPFDVAEKLRHLRDSL